MRLSSELTLLMLRQQQRLCRVYERSMVATDLFSCLPDLSCLLVTSLLYSVVRLNKVWKSLIFVLCHARVNGPSIHA